MFFKKTAKIIQIDKDRPDKNIVKLASESMEKGGLVVYPTDTAYGIGANAFNTNAIKKLYELKGRDYNKPTHVVVRDWNMTKGISITNRAAKILFDNYLPGPLTIIVSKKFNMPDILTGGLSTIGIRIPNLRLTTMISNIFGKPYTTPSANRSGEKTPYSIDEVDNVLDLSKVDLVLDAGELDRSVKPSTIVDVSENPIKILREGPISSNQIVHSFKINKL